MMTKQEIANEFIRCFCAGDIKGIEPLLATDLSFTGTFNTYTSATEYLDSLKTDPPEKCGYKILSVTKNNDSVAVFYEYQKPERVTLIAQSFKIRGQKIRDVLLIFDGRGFSRESCKSNG